MAKNEVVVHIEDRQVSELKKALNQACLKIIREMDKLSAQVKDNNKKMNDILAKLEEKEDESDG